MDFNAVKTGADGISCSNSKEGHVVFDFIYGKRTRGCTIRQGNIGGGDHIKTLCFEDLLLC
jgi:hypothetical protein